MRSTRNKSKAGGCAPEFDPGRSLQPVFWRVIRRENVVNGGVLLRWEPDAVESDRDVVRSGQSDQRQKARNPMMCETGQIQSLEFVQRCGCEIKQVSRGCPADPHVVLFK